MVIRVRGRSAAAVDPALDSRQAYSAKIFGHQSPHFAHELPGAGFHLFGSLSRLLVIKPEKVQDAMDEQPGRVGAQTDAGFVSFSYGRIYRDDHISQKLG